MRRLTLVFLILLIVPIQAGEVKLLQPGLYEAYSKYNRVHFIVNPAKEMTAKLKKDLCGSQAHGVDGRAKLRKGTKVKVLYAETFLRREKRSAATHSDGEKVYYGPSTKQKWKYGVARIKVLEGKLKGKTGWIMYSQMKVADSTGKAPKRNSYTSYLRKPPKKKK